MTVVLIIVYIMIEIGSNNPPMFVLVTSNITCIPDEPVRAFVHVALSRLKTVLFGQGRSTQVRLPANTGPPHCRRSMGIPCLGIAATTLWTLCVTYCLVVSQPAHSWWAGATPCNALPECVDKAKAWGNRMESVDHVHQQKHESWVSEHTQS